MSSESAPEKKPGILDPKSNLKALWRILILLFILIGGIWLFFRFTAGEKAANRVTSVILRQPIELKNSIETLNANSFKGVALNLPYTGTVTIDVVVRKGNDLSIYVVRPDQAEKIKNKESFTFYEGLNAEKTRTYRRSGRLEAGSYYLILMDKTLGILSESSSDNQIQARLEP